MAKLPDKTKVQVTALDAFVNVNTLFTAIVFLGISFRPDTTTGQTSCEAGPNIAKRLVVFEVISFSCFLFSSLVAQGLKIHISLMCNKDKQQAMDVMVEERLLNFGLMASGIGSVVGCAFLMCSMVDVIQLKLGMLSCGNSYSVPAVSTLVVLVSSAVVVYFYCLAHAVKNYAPPGIPEGKETEL